MKQKILPILALIAFAAAPVVIGSAGESAKESAKESTKGNSPEVAKDPKATEAKKVETPKKKASSECLASEEVIQDLDLREKKLKEREESLKEKEKELEAQSTSIKEEMAKLDGKRAEIKGVHEKELAEREEQVGKLVETFEGMSPKSAASVLAGVDDELSVMTLTKLTSAKAGKILSNLKPEKSARLSEMMAYGKATKRKEATHGESERAPASN